MLNKDIQFLKILGHYYFNICYINFYCPFIYENKIIKMDGNNIIVLLFLLYI